MQETVLFLNMVEEDPTKRLKLAGARRYAAAAGWRLVPVKYGRSIREKLPELLAKYRPAGCICDEDATPTRFSPGMFCGIPVIFANAYGGGYGATIRIGADNAAVARAAFRELAAGQPEAFAVVGDWQPLEWSLVRMGTFCAEAKAVKAICHAFREKKWRGRAAAVAALRPFVAKLPRHTAIYAVNDIIARRIADAAHAEGRRIPQDLTLLGTDNDIAVCDAASPTISSIQLDFERMGYLAAKMLGEMMAGGSRFGADNADARKRVSPNPIAIGPLLAVRRESTGGYGRREPHVLEAVEIIRREACEGLSVAELAGRLPGSRRLLDLRFREAMGHSIHEEMLQVRLERVFDLLRRLDVRIGAVADFSGFALHQLEKVFRIRFGCSLREWRRRNVQP